MELENSDTSSDHVRSPDPIIRERLVGPINRQPINQLNNLDINDQELMNALEASIVSYDVEEYERVYQESRYMQIIEDSIRIQEEYEIRKLEKKAEEERRLEIVKTERRSELQQFQQKTVYIFSNNTKSVISDAIEKYCTLKTNFITLSPDIYYEVINYIESKNNRFTSNYRSSLLEIIKCDDENDNNNDNNIFYESDYEYTEDAEENDI